MARQGSTLCKCLMSLSVNTERHSSASNPDPNVHILSPEKHSCQSTSCQSSSPLMLQHSMIKSVTKRVIFVLDYCSLL